MSSLQVIDVNNYVNIGVYEYICDEYMGEYICTYIQS